MPVVPTLFNYAEDPKITLLLCVETLKNLIHPMSSFKQEKILVAEDMSYYIRVCISQQIIIIIIIIIIISTTLIIITTTTTIIIKSHPTETRLREICETEKILCTDFAFSEKVGRGCLYLISVREHRGSAC
jgi:hypothetical protein